MVWAAWEFSQSRRNVQKRNNSKSNHNSHSFFTLRNRRKGFFTGGTRPFQKRWSSPQNATGFLSASVYNRGSEGRVFVETGEEVLILYADVLAFLNFAMDFLCLCAAAKVASRRFIGWRVVMGALFGAVYSVAAPFVPEAWQAALHLPASVLLCLIAFPWGNGKTFLKTWGSFLMSCACLGGLVSGAYYIGQRRVTTWGIVLTAVLCCLPVVLYGVHCRKKVYEKNMKIEIEFGGKSVKADLLVDSGNLVTEPFSALPVVILSSEVLPAPLNKPTPGNSPVPLRAIPIRTETGLGLLYGFIPDKITLCPPFEKQRQVEAVIGIDTDNSDFAGLDGLLPGALL